MPSALRNALLLVTLSVGLGACDEGTDTPSQPSQDSESGQSSQSVTPGSESAERSIGAQAEERMRASSAGLACASEALATYPEGPYAEDATLLGQVMNNHSFTGSDGAPMSFGKLRSTGEHPLLLLSTAAGWCAECIQVQGSLESLHQTYGTQGLQVMVTVFEDAQSNPATLSSAQNWKAQNGLSFVVVADTSNVMGTYYDVASTPLNLLIDLCTMEVLHVKVGFNEESLLAHIEEGLGL